MPMLPLKRTGTTCYIVDRFAFFPSLEHKQQKELVVGLKMEEETKVETAEESANNQQPASTIPSEVQDVVQAVPIDAIEEGDTTFGQKETAGDEQLGKDTDDGPLVTLESGDGRKFPLTMKAAKMSKVVERMLKDCGDGPPSEDSLPMKAVDGDTLELVVKWLEQHKNDTDQPPATRRRIAEDSDDSDSDSDGDEEKPATAISDWDAQFLPTKDAEKNQLFKLLNASNYMEIQPLLALGCKWMAGKIEGKDVDWVRDYLNMENDYTPEEYARVKQETAWARGGGNGSAA